MTTKPFVLCDNLVKIYKVADLEVVALQGLDLTVNKGEIMALVGASGSGKSTLLNVMGGLDTPSAGGVWINDQDMLKMTEKDRVQYKRDTVGFVWQQPARNLLPYLSARENVELPMMLTKGSSKKRRDRALELLDMVGLSDRASFRPDRLSGGQQQRVALAVSLANNPPLLLADEPTGQVDSETAEEIFSALRRINETFETTIIVVTHDQKVANRVDRVVAIRDGRTSTEIRRERNLQDGTMQEEEWVILDRAGRLQMPQPYIQSLEMKDRVKLRLEDSHVSVWPEQEENQRGDAEAQRKGSGTNGSVWRPPSVRSGMDDAPGEGVQRGGRGRAVSVKNLTRLFQLGAEEIRAVDGLTLDIPRGQMVVVKGPSGSGKTTMLNLIAGLDEPTAGSVVINGRELAGMSSQELIDLRRKEIGFVFQTFGLLPFLSARENIEAPLRLVKTVGKERNARVDEVLDLVGLTERAKHRTYELSGGEQQRIALARALANKPSIILADEPTGQLDTATGYQIIDLLRDIVEQTGVTAIIASHDPKVEEAADLVYVLEDGRLAQTINGQVVGETAVAAD
ncbi:MAG: ABC transporter ATP-binding protein [Chloroflexi bacterium]|nr:ABC transporter ATP-binding protein [Chloroflexota bacterium]